MEISFKCNACRVKLGVDVVYAGRSMYCPKCEAKIQIPKAGLGTWSTLGDFRLIKEIGEGSSGKVYLVKQISMDRELALKILNPEISAKPELLDQFYNEVKIIAKLIHPNIVTAFKAGEDSGYHYLAMTYVPGGTLEDYVLINGPIQEKQALSYALSCAQGLQYAWEKERILHLDIKPENLMLDKNGKLKIADLGIARSLNDPSDDNRVVGTPAYMSPEQVMGSSDLDSRSDIFSLGGTIYYLLTGKAPFGSGSVKEILKRVANQELVDPRTHNKKISQGTVDLLNKMMTKNRKKRISSWSELIDHLKFHIESDPEEKKIRVKRPPTEGRIRIKLPFKK